MATRTTIYILSEDKEGIHQQVKVCKHWDGEIEAMFLAWLRDFNRDFSAKRGDDPQCKMAQLLRSSDKYARKYGIDDSHHTGWSIVPINHDCGAEWEYHLNVDGSVTEQNLLYNEYFEDND